jgi:hypothetical protein
LASGKLNAPRKVPEFGLLRQEFAMIGGEPSSIEIPKVPDIRGQ